MKTIAIAAFCAALGAAMTAAASERAEDPRNAIVAFGGLMTDENWGDLFLGAADINFEDAALLGIGVARRVARPLDGLDIEIEAQIVRHFGDQRHWELNAPVATARWTAFPWDDTVDTSAAFGLGVSFASEKPELEARNEGDSRPVMTYWMMEIALAQPGSDWEVLGRIHHRSTAFGTFGDDGGSNALALGVRRRF